MLTAGKACQPLLHSSLSLYEEMIREESLRVEWQKKGLLFVYQTKTEMDKYAEVDRLLADEFDEPAVRYDGEALRELEPALKPGLAGGWHYEEDAHLCPDRLMSEWGDTLRRLGVRMIENATAEEFAVQNDRAVGLRTTQESIAADVFVVAGAR